MGATTFAQTKPDSAKKAKPVIKPKAEYKPDPAKKFTITDLTADEIYMIIAEPEMWTALEYSDKLSGKQIQQRKAAAAAARAKVQNQIEAYLVADYKKFQADTAAKTAKTKK